jgi:hypothetical protein
MDPLLPCTIHPSVYERQFVGNGTRTNREQIADARRVWLANSPASDIRNNYDRDGRQFVAFTGIPDARSGHALPFSPFRVG